MTIVSLDAAAVGGWKVGDKRIDTLHKTFHIALRGQVHLPKLADDSLSDREAPSVYLLEDPMPHKIHSISNEERTIALQPLAFGVGGKVILEWKDFLERIDKARTKHAGAAYVPRPMGCEHIPIPLVAPTLPSLVEQQSLPPPVPPPATLAAIPVPLPPPASSETEPQRMMPPPNPYPHITPFQSSVTGRDWIVDLSASSFDTLFETVLAHASLQDDLSKSTPTRGDTKRTHVLFSRLAPTLGMCDGRLRIDNMPLVVSGWAIMDVNRYLVTAVSQSSRIDVSLARAALVEFPGQAERKLFERRWQLLQALHHGQEQPKGPTGPNQRLQSLGHRRPDPGEL